MYQSYVAGIYSVHVERSYVSVICGGHMRRSHAEERCMEGCNGKAGDADWRGKDYPTSLSD